MKKDIRQTSTHIHMYAKQEKTAEQSTSVGSGCSVRQHIQRYSIYLQMLHFFLGLESFRKTGDCSCPTVQTGRVIQGVG